MTPKTSVSAEQDGKTEGRVQHFVRGDRRAQKIGITNDIGNIHGFPTKPDSARQPYPGHQSALAAGQKLRGLYGFFMPNLDASKYTRLLIYAP